MHIHPTGRADVSQRGSNSEMRAGERERREVLSEKERWFCKEGKEKKRSNRKEETVVLVLVSL